MPSISEVSSFIKNKDFLNTALSQSWAVIAGPLALVFIPLFLNPVNQGYYYAFISISALSVLADLGFSNIILQFAAHEFAFLRHEGKKIGYADPDGEIHLRKLSSLFVFAIRWTATIILFAYPAIFLIGFFLFRNNAEEIHWIVPWILFSAGSALSFLNGTILAFLEGCSQVAKIQRIRFVNAFIFSAVVLTGLAMGLDLYSLAFAGLASALFTGGFLVISFRATFYQLLSYSKDIGYKWRSEILKLFWKYVISFASGYVIFQIYTPIAFRFFGAEEAGRVGFSMALWSAIMTVANIWIVSVLPKMNILAATKRWEELDRFIFRRFIAGGTTFLFFSLLFFAVYFLVIQLFPIADRFTSGYNLLVLFLTWSLQFCISMMAIYLRVHKEDPFYLINLACSLFIGLLTIFIAITLTSDYIFTGFAAASALFAPVYLHLFLKKRKEWHT